jgi:hypothetical protein
MAEKRDPYYLYGLVDPRTKVLRYIGKTKNPANRYSQHCNSYKHSEKRTPVVEWIGELANEGLKPDMIFLVKRTNWIFGRGDWEENWIYVVSLFGGDLLNVVDKPEVSRDG